MARITAFTNLTLDGVMQAPALPDEDPRDCFAHGGWAAPFAAMSEAGDAIGDVRAVLFGRWTYESFYAYWPHQHGNPFSTFFDDIPKYVVSTTLEAPPAWRNTTLLGGDVAEAIRRLKAVQEGDCIVFGSGVLLQSLLRHGLVDRYVLLIHPLVLGSGRRLFADDGTFAALRLVASKTTASGVVIATYEPAPPGERAG